MAAGEMTAEQAAERELAEQLERVRATGPAPDALTRSFALTLSQLRTRLGSETRAEFTEERCFRGGCTFVLQFPRALPYEAIDTALLQDDAFVRWPGGKFRSGVFSSDAGPADARTARVLARVTWIFFLDDVPATD